MIRRWIVIYYNGDETKAAMIDDDSSDGSVKMPFGVEPHQVADDCVDITAIIEVNDNTDVPTTKNSALILPIRTWTKRTFRREALERGRASRLAHAHGRIPSGRPGRQTGRRERGQNQRGREEPVPRRRRSRGRGLTTDLFLA
jgi:hypothetical protein